MDSYVVTDDNLLNLLNVIDDFETRMDEFLINYPNYNYEVKLTKKNNLWESVVKIIKDEENNK